MNGRGESRNVPWRAYAPIPHRQRALKNRLLLVLLALGVSAQAPARAGSDDWETASDIGLYGLMGAALSIPAVRGDWRGLRQAGTSIAITGGVAFGLKDIIHAERPDNSGDDSFPSAHAALSFASAATLHRRYGWRAGLPATLVATVVGIARVQADRHHWYDVAAGAALGELAGMYLTTPFDDRVRLLPWADSRGGGVVVSMVF